MQPARQPAALADGNNATTPPPKVDTLKDPRSTSSLPAALDASASAERAGATLIIVGTLVFVAALLGIFTRPTGFLAAFWPVNALLVGVMVRRPQLATPAGWVGALLGYLAADLLTGSALIATLRLTTINVGEALVAYLLLVRLRKADQQLRTPISVLYVFAICAVAAVAAASLACAYHLMQTGTLTSRRWVIWFVSEIASLAVTLPVVLTAPALRHWRLRFWRLRMRWSDALATLRRSLPFVALLASALASVLVGGPGALAFPIPALLWCALHYSLFSTALLMLVFSIGEILAVSMGLFGFNNMGNMQDHMISIRLGVTFMALGPLTVATINSVRNELLQSLSHAASHDFLTHALSRGAFEQRAREALAHAADQGLPLALVMLDIDHFKQINDRHGHAAGDQVLTKFARTTRQTLRDGDLFGRVGGDEFAILLPETGQAHAMEVVERLRTNVQHSAAVLEDGTALAVTLSIGVADAPEFSSMSLEQLLRTADKALYHSKQSGRNQTSFAPIEPEMAEL